MDPRGLVSPATWKDIAVELGWRALPVRAAGRALSWPLSAERLPDLCIRWPTEYEWPPCEKLVGPLRRGFECYVRVDRVPIPQPYQGIVQIEVVLDEAVHEVTLDYSDYLDINGECAERSPLYFKMQYHRDGYARDNVVPGGYPPADRMIYDFLGRLRALRDTRPPSFEVYGRFSLEFATGIRRDAIRLLSQNQSFRYEGGAGRVRYSRFLREAARAAICIDLPGNGDFCFRLIDYLAIGSCIIGPRHRTRFHVPLVDRRHIVYVKDDLSDLVDLCAEYLEDHSKRETLCLGSRDFFDRYLRREQLAAYYLHSCFERLS